jgi:hypothetical protein
VATYVYGIVEANAQPPEGGGIADAPLSLVAGDDAAALVSDLAAREVRLGREEILVHARVLEQALARGTVLPMRFGVVMDGPDEIRQRLLQAHAGELRAQLTGLEGKVEVRIRGVYEEQALMSEILREDRAIARLRDSVRGRPDDATYYERIQLGEAVAAAVERRREHDSRNIVDLLARSALGVELSKLAHERVVVNASFLVERKRLDEFDEALDLLADDQAGRMRFKYTGPLPPHSFVEFAESA